MDDRLLPYSFMAEFPDAVQSIELERTCEGLFSLFRPDRENFGFYFDEWGEWPETKEYSLVAPHYAFFLDASEESDAIFQHVRAMEGFVEYIVRPIPAGRKPLLIESSLHITIEGGAAIIAWLEREEQVSREVWKRWQEHPLPIRMPNEEELQEAHERHARRVQMAEENFQRIKASPQAG